MIFYRSPASQDGTGPPLRTLRVLTAVSLASYPAGALTLALGPPGGGGLFAFEIAGLALIALALLSATPVMGSRLQRIVADDAATLDEFELELRHRAASAAYASFTAMVLVAILYGAIASDKGWWFPRSYEEYNGLFWGAFLYATLLPTAFLAWRLRDDPDEA